MDEALDPGLLGGASIAAVPATLPASNPAGSGALITPATWMTASAPSTSAASAAWSIERAFDPRHARRAAAGGGG